MDLVDYNFDILMKAQSMHSMARLPKQWFDVRIASPDFSKLSTLG